MSSHFCYRFQIHAEELDYPLLSKGYHSQPGREDLVAWVKDFGNHPGDYSIPLGKGYQLSDKVLSSLGKGGEDFIFRFREYDVDDYAINHVGVGFWWGSITLVVERLYSPGDAIYGS